MIEKLLDESVFPHPVDYFKKIETHSSWVILTGKYAYKIKKPVNFGFLDYSTYDKRRYFCERELKLNRVLTPIYLDVVPIFKNKGGYSFKEGEEIVDYAVKMKELPQDCIMSSLLEKNRVSLGDLEKIADIVSNFHKNSETDDEIKKYGDISMVKFNWDENFSQTESYIGITIFRRIYEDIKERTYNFLEKRELFEKRKENYVKFLHGDLHTGNIFINNGDIHIFDRIEFNMRFACSDIAADVGFLIMDLEHRGRNKFANFFLLRYLQKTEDYEMLKLIDFYKSYRAYVRGKVIGFLYSQNKDKTLIDLSRKYFDISLQYLKNIETKPHIYVLSGLPASGKSTMASKLSFYTGGIHIQNDLIRRVVTERDFDSHHYANFEEGIYSKETTLKSYKKMFEETKKIINQGKSVILDASFSSPRYKSMLLERFRAVTFVRCEISDHIAKKRINEKKEKDTLSDATFDIYLEMKSSFHRDDSDIVLNCEGDENMNFQKLVSLLKIHKI